MIQEIIKFISNVNYCYITLAILFLIVSLLFLSKHIKKTIIKELFIIIYVTISWIGFYYLNDVFNSIFSLQYLGIKPYLILLIIGNMIMLITLNKKISIPYKVVNYILFTINMIILAINIVILVSNNYTTFIVASNKEIITLININFIIFIIYLNVICLICIIKQLLKLYKENKTIKHLDKIVIANEPKEEITPQKETKILNNNNLEISDSFYIDGIDCSIIFEDTDKETAIKNYYILLNNVNAKLTNGYTLKENIKLKNIINKLNIKDLNNINLDVNKLNKITIDEYNLLKRYLDTKNRGY